MPESPEVEALARFLAEEAAGREIAAVDVLEFRAIKTRGAPPSGLIGRSITGAVRHGKHVELVLDTGSLVVSLGRHGWMRWNEGGSAGEESAADAPPALATMDLSGAILEVTDAGSWVSLGLFVVATADDVPAIAKLGPDPAVEGFTRHDFDNALGGRRKQIKAILQEQESLAGIGNAYSDEILHLARVSPVTHAARLGDDETERLYQATVTTVRDAIAARTGVPIAELKAAKMAAMRVHGRTGESCPVCGDTIRDLTFAGASAQYCPTCQNGGAPL
ncbi:DNA-formamidopyrimidine glycosylase family protein [Microbacterium sp. M3]|uniref:DNA-formamidopyrimidine glycosylase family protein n=1 Tax=Microbacterium arthrosphaerae TaxID=792652 RepID=A0ABU4GVU4_9MICO|nr:MULTISPECIES: DNA-formamidopyrimidine glycosylase family protein [Microbacterium]MDW4571187.1 DNA-formamidopyrimidine glycosylase family protein [Microbacterium arthrosphaerae]MDW7605042.1 DNA-formamidopyrimidine glycosylase family protein [Microbacterium sp. M3]